jgi:Tol biopolymer transport system component
MASQLCEPERERDPSVSIGVPVWSPSCDPIAFIATRSGVTRQWLINRDGSGLRAFVSGYWASWSPDGKWLCDVATRNNVFVIEKDVVLMRGLSTR